MIPCPDPPTRPRSSLRARLLEVAEDKVWIVDKQPANFIYAGLIRLILPNARIIHTTRDPAATCVSCYSKLFRSGQEFSYDLGELGRYYRAYRELMLHWSTIFPATAMLDVSYENLVQDLEGQAKRIVDYCGLPWEARCLDFHKTKRVITTASAAQVRQPLYHNALKRWRLHESQIAPLLHELKDIPVNGRRTQ